MLDTARFLRLLAAIALSWTAYGGYGLSDAYGQRVAGESSPPASADGMTTQADPNGAVMLKPGVRIEDLSIDFILNTAPNDLGNTRRPLGPAPRTTTVADDRKQAQLAALMRRPKQAAPTTDLTSEIAAQNADIAAHRAATINPETGNPYGFMDRLEASWGDWLGVAIVHAIEDADPDVDPQWTKNYARNFAVLEEDARTSEEVSERREAQSQADYEIIVRRQRERAQRNLIIDSNGTGWMFRLVLGPAGLFLGIICMAAMYWFARKGGEKPGYQQRTVGSDI